jgi:hypothetical protein
VKREIEIVWFFSNIILCRVAKFKWVVLMGENQVSECRRCVLYRAHDMYDFLGVCVYRDELLILTPGAKTCEKYEEFSMDELKRLLNERGWLYCVSCRKWIWTVEELQEHRNDIVIPEFFSDIIASEEAPAAD